ncbi:hypothetical protein ACFYXH_21435 [Streptomyces sp. NPDC002730]|uniref:hypothetical protein n=1 Tax=Streptomyces sp. NPDC002730 TaxID=3364662 RepID=UPI00367950D3
MIAGLTLPSNSGFVEGHVNRIKMLERQMLEPAEPKKQHKAGVRWQNAVLHRE